MQDWYLQYQLTSVNGSFGSRSVGGSSNNTRVSVDPAKLRAYNLSIADVSMAIQRSNGEVGGPFDGAGGEGFILRVRAYIQSLDD